MTKPSTKIHHSLPEQTKTDINLLKTALRYRYHTQDQLYDMRVKLHELRQGSSLEKYINDFDTLAHHLELPEQQKFIISLLNKNRHFLADNHRHTTMLLPLQSANITLQIRILILSWWISCNRSVRKLVSNILESNKNRTPINILNALLIDHTTINAILWDILTREMPPMPVPHDNHHSHPPIKPKLRTKLEELTFQANTTIIVTWFKIIPCRTNSASTHLSTLIISTIHTHHPSTYPTHTTHPHASLSTLTHPIIKLILNQSPYQPE